MRCVALVLVIASTLAVAAPATVETRYCGEPRRNAQGEIVRRATPEKGWPFYRFFFVWPWPFSPSHAVMIDIGWKFKLAHRGMAKDAPEKDRLRGFVCSPSPWKKL